jgi:hypothetical protein
VNIKSYSRLSSELRATNKIRPTRFNSMMTEDYVFNKYVIISCCAYGILLGMSEGKRSIGRTRHRWEDDIVTDLINALPGNSSVNTIQHATMEKAVLSVDLTDAPIDWLDSDHVKCDNCSSMSVPRL